MGTQLSQRKTFSEPWMKSRKKKEKSTLNNSKNSLINMDTFSESVSNSESSIIPPLRLTPSHMVMLMSEMLCTNMERKMGVQMRETSLSSTSNLFSTNQLCLIFTNLFGQAPPLTLENT